MQRGTMRQSNLLIYIRAVVVVTVRVELRGRGKAFLSTLRATQFVINLKKGVTFFACSTALIFSNARFVISQLNPQSW
jgi:hypothetical protein